MSFLGIGYGPATEEFNFLQRADLAVSQNVARDQILQNRMRRMRGGMAGLGLSPELIALHAFEKQQREAKIEALKAWRAGAAQRKIAEDMARKAAAAKKAAGIHGLGIAASPRTGTRAWWIWYATQYLPQYYNISQVQQYVYASPYYAQFGTPFVGTYAYLNTYQQPNQQYQVQPYQYQYQTPYNPYQNQQTPYQYPYSTVNYPQYATNYPYYGYGNQYYNPNAQAQYTYYNGQQGVQACQQQGGYWDYTQQACNAITGQQPYGSTVYGPSTTPPNVVGMPEWQAVAALNAAGFNVWELNRDGVSQGVPPGYASNRVDVSITNGVVTAAAVG